MTDLPRISFFLADRRHPVRPEDPLWRHGLPLSPAVADPPPADTPLTYGEYFEALVAFLSHRSWLPLRAQLHVNAGVDIFLEKHGAFYHPARIEITGGSAPCELAVNVAVSQAGKDLMAREVELLRRLASPFGSGRLPTVYHTRTVAVGADRYLPMFMAQWFSGFWEFHLTGDPASGGRLAVWTPSGPLRLDAAQTRSLYRETAGLLTDYYDIFTTEQILDWHHAAGDFIVHPLGDGRVDMRLVTVRRYGPLLPETAADLETVLLGAALFLVHTSLRMRLDRCDGVGQPVLASPDVIAPTVEGFFHALERKRSRGEIPGELAEVVAVYLHGLTGKDLAPMIRAFIDGRPTGDPTRRIMAEAAEGHAAELQRILSEAPGPGQFHYIQR